MRKIEPIAKDSFNQHEPGTKGRLKFSGKGEMGAVNEVKVNEEKFTLLITPHFRWRFFVPSPPEEGKLETDSHPAKGYSGKTERLF